MFRPADVLIDNITGDAACPVAFGYFAAQFLACLLYTSATLQSFRSKNLVLAGREAATEKRFLCRDQ